MLSRKSLSTSWVGKGTSQSFRLKAKRDFTSITPTVANQALHKGTHSIAVTKKNVSIEKNNTRLEYF